DINSGSRASAQGIVPRILEHLEISSVLDVGCGEGAWLAVWKELGVESLFGIDGEYVDLERLQIDETSFKGFDLSKPFDLKREFDLVQCLEVAEHLPTSSSVSLVKSIVQHGDLVLFSAAPKGQGGSDHINEQSYEYWRRLFAQHEYVALDYIRPLLFDESSVKQWYRYNTFMFVARDAVTTLPVSMQNSIVPENQKLKDISPLSYQVKKVLKQAIPSGLLGKYHQLRS
ncbi:MAG: methyltransferase domain-containing protein, partial [Cyanobacteria bacterium P01_A01_bin.137]